MLAGIPPTPELLAKVDALPPANELPGVSQAGSRAADPHFTLRRLLRPIALALFIGLVLDGLDAVASIAMPALVRGVPLPGLDDGRNDIADECALTFAGTFLALFLELWRANPFPVPAPEQIDAGLRDQLIRYRDALGTDIPVGAVLVFLRCWTVLYGAVSMEVFGHMRFALEDAAPMFEMTLGDLASLVGLRYPLPR